MPVPALDVAAHLCRKSAWTIPNAHLHKIMYLCQREQMHQTGEPLINESFYATDYGPLIPELHKKLSCFGARPIRNIFWAAKPLPDHLLPLMKLAFKHFVPMTGGQLVAQTHRGEGAWNALYIPGHKVPITLKDIQAEVAALTR